jgi:acetate---CoA ligase (ADP-forming) subunit beta
MLATNIFERLGELAQHRTSLLEHEAKDILRDTGFSVPLGRFIRKGEMLPQTLGLKYPLAAKVSSERITSKSDLRGVRTGLQDEQALRLAFEELMRIDNAEGVLVEEMALQGVEVIIGGVIDKQFGPVMMFGLGGVYTELFRDVSFGLAPLGKDDAYWMINGIKGQRLLEGFRGNPPVDKETLADILVKASEIMATGLVEEIDLNPVSLYADGAIVLDAKMKLRAVELQKL